jgi:hypothetical protein
MKGRAAVLSRRAGPAVGRWAAAVGAVVVLAGCAASPPAPKLPPLVGRTTTTLAIGQSAVLPLRLVVVALTDQLEGDAAPRFAEQAPAFVDHLNAIYAVASVRFHLRSVDQVAVERDRWESHVPLSSITPPVDENAFTLYLVPGVAQRGVAVNGMALGPRRAMVSLGARLRGGGAPGTSEPVVRVSGHLLGSMLGLGVSKDDGNLMALGTTGTELQPQQVRSLQIPTEFVQPVSPPHEL